ncbi:MAG: aminotransferase class V-fold PLP-dependent enzyme, partial [Clostridia bacterium]|nr:aminotransferase class V-fold PLP-dependent enzyme [Clostridia bacterium]
MGANRRRVYLDNAATSYPKPEAVYRAVDWFLREVGASAGRGGYRLALKADEIVYQARSALAR